MATDFTQDSVLHFLQSCGGSVKNSDLLLHFRNFIRDHPDRNRNREQFKKFVNSVATVKQIDGVSFVVLRKKFKGHVPGSGAGSSPEPPRPTAGKNTELSPESAKLSPAWSAEKPRQKAPQREAAAPAPPGVPAEKTILPAAGIILNNNNNVETNLNLKQVSSAPELSGRPAAAPQVKTPSVSGPPAPVQCTKVGQQRVGFVPPPVAPAVRHHVEPTQQVQEPLRGRQPERSLHQEPPPLQLQDAPRRIRHRKSYKSAVSYDEDEDEEEEVVEVQVKGGSAGGARPLSAPLRDTEKVIPASLPSITATPAPPSVSSSSSASSSERQLPKIYIQDMDVEMMPPGGSWGSGVGHRGQWAAPGLESSSTRRSLPLDAERYVPSPDRAEEVEPHRDVHADRRYSQPTGVHLKPNQGPDPSQGAGLSSSHSSILSRSSDTGFCSGDWPPSGSPGGLRRNSSYEDLLAVTGKTRGRSQIQEVLQRAHESVMHRATIKTAAPWHHSTGNLLDVQESTARLPPFHRSTDHLHDDQGSTARVVPWHLSTDDLYNDREDAESSEGSTSSPPLRQRPWVARRVSSQLRSRMCRSLGADLDQLLEEQARAAGGSEAARLNRLHLISSTLSLRYNLSSSSLSSCSTPSRSQSLAELVERVEGKGGRRSLPTAVSTTGHQEGTGRQSLVPLEPREHAWLVKGAAGAWPDIYSLFREDTSLLNRQDFISGFTVLHWIAKHGDHRVLNTLWYGVQKAGLTFDMNAKSACGHTPLHIAAMHGHRNMMRLLVKKFNADVKLRDTAGKRPWQYLSCSEPPDIFQLLGAPPRRPAGGGDRKEDSSWEQPQQQQRRRRRHHLSFASSGERPVTISGTMRVKRSSSIAAFLKHKSLRRFQDLSEPSI